MNSRLRPFVSILNQDFPQRVTPSREVFIGLVYIPRRNALWRRLQDYLAVGGNACTTHVPAQISAEFR